MAVRLRACAFGDGRYTSRVLLPLVLLRLAAADVTAPPGDPIDALIALDRAIGGEDVVLPSEALPLRLALTQLPRLWAEGAYLEAAVLLQRAVVEPLLDPVAQFLEAESLAYGGEVEAARAALTRASQSPDVAVQQLADRRLAELELQLGEAAAAATRLRDLIRRGPDSAILEEDLGRALGDTPEGAVALRRAYLLDPEGEVGAEAQRALLAARLSLVGLSTHEVLLYAQRLLRAGHAEEALAAVNAAPRADRSGELEVCAAQCERALGHPDAARQHLSRAAKLSDPKAAALARIALARAQESDGNVAAALALLGQVAKARPRSPEGSEALYLAAWMAMDHGETAEGFRLFAQLAARRGERHAAEARWWTGWAQELAGQPARALAAWQPLLTPLTPGLLGPQALYWSARAREELSEKAAAEDLRRRLQVEAPTSYYGLLDRHGLPSEVQSRLLPECRTQTLNREGQLGQSVQRGELLWSLGLLTLARAELNAADQLARSPAQAMAVAEAESALGEPGKAFALVQSRGGGCFVGGVLAPEFFPRPFRNEVETAAAAAGIDPIWVWAIMRQESRFDPRARSAALAGGAMQLLEGTSSRIAAIAGTPRVDRDRPGPAIDAAAWYLRALSDRFGGDLALVAAAYNAGPSAVAAWLGGQGQRRLDTFVEQIPFRETRQYVKAVVANAAAYRTLFGPSGALIDPTAAPPTPVAGVSF